MEQTFRVLYTTNACGDHFFYGIFCPVSPSIAIINKTCSASIFRFHWLTLQSSGRALWKLPWGLSCAPGTNTPMELSLEALQDTQLLKLYAVASRVLKTAHPPKYQVLTITPALGQGQQSLLSLQKGQVRFRPRSLCPLCQLCHLVPRSHTG